MMQLATLLEELKEMRVMRQGYEVPDAALWKMMIPAIRQAAVLGFGTYLVLHHS